MQTDWATPILRYWFEELQPAAWFRTDEGVDAAISTRFHAAYEQLAKISPEDLTTPLQHVAAVIALDQFPRNMFRGSPPAFATDRLALSIAEHAIATGLDQQLTQQQRLFLYMPFQHSEDRAVQARSIALFTQLGIADNLDYAHRHKDIVDRFGRFPHRNEVLGRESTTEELQFIATHRGFCAALQKIQREKNTARERAARALPSRTVFRTGARIFVLFRAFSCSTRRVPALSE